MGETEGKGAQGALEFVGVGLSHQTAPIAVRERLAGVLQEFPQLKSE